MLRGVPYYKPRDDFSPNVELALDFALTLVALSAVVLMSGIMSDAQVAAACLLPLIGLSLAFVRKHERQQHGIYRNQNAWIEEHASLVMSLLPELRNGRPASEAPATAVDSSQVAGSSRLPVLALVGAGVAVVALGKRLLQRPER